MHPEITSNKPARCSICGMKLVKNTEIKHSSHNTHALKDAPESYTPLFIIIGLIALATITLGLKDYTLSQFSFAEIMRYFMAGFFLVFSGFKLLDIKGFAEGYYTYDLIAQKFFSYGYIYPFLELTLGLAYLLGIDSPVLHLFTFILMTISGIGVMIKVLKKESFQCACLGTLLKVPLTKVTLIEDFGMALMALLMLLM